jgi:tetratricopeptide (TPR) repeat protein
MYLRGSKWSMSRRRRQIHPFRLAVLVVLIGALIYVNQVVVPKTGPLFIPTPTPTRDPASYVAEGQQMFNEGKLAKAIEAYKQAVRAKGTDVAVYLTLAQLELYYHSYADALSDAGNALVLSPTNSTAMAFRGYAQYSLGDYVAAEATLKNAIDADPNNPLGHAFYAELIGYEIQEMNKPRSLGINEAIDEAHKAIDLGPNLVETHRAYGYILIWTTYYEKAAEEFQAGIEINKNIPDLYIGLGQCYANKDETREQAVDAFLKAIPLNPTDPIPNVELAKVYSALGQYPMAIQYAELAAKSDPTNPDRYGRWGYYLRKNGQYEQAITELELAIKGGTTSEGIVVKAMPLSRSGNIALWYAAYGLALADTTPSRCTDALAIAQALLQAMPDDENVVYNANAIMDKCKQQIIGTFTPTAAPKDAESTPAP